MLCYWVSKHRGSVQKAFLATVLHFGVRSLNVTILICTLQHFLACRYCWFPKRLFHSLQQDATQRTSFHWIWPLLVLRAGRTPNRQAWWTYKYQYFNIQNVFKYHSNFFLRTLSGVLKNDGHTVELQRIPYWNFVELRVNGEKVFSCDIRDLDYGKGIFT